MGEEFRKHEGLSKGPIYRLERRLSVSAKMADCWGFFSDPKNLEKITPPWLRFEVVNDAAEQIYPGMILEYRVSPLPGWRTTWVSEITHVERQRLFVDEQRIGPYRLWHHEHWFSALRDGGVMMNDRVVYALAASPGSGLAAKYLVQPRLEEIFDFRERAIAEIFR